MKAVFVHKKDNRVKSIQPWSIDGGLSPMQNYYVFLTSIPVEIGEDWSEEVAQARKVNPDRTDINDEGDEYTLYGNYSPYTLCQEPYHEI